MASAVGLQAVLLNDGKTVKKLVQIQNTLNDGGATVTLEPKLRWGRWPAGYLFMEQSAHDTWPALRNTWYSDKFQPGGVEYSVSADFQPVESDGAWDGFGGVMGWLDVESGVGIAFYVDADEAFRVVTVAFKTDNGDENETAAGLFNLDGSAAAQIDFGSASARLGTTTRPRWPPSNWRSPCPQRRTRPHWKGSLPGSPPPFTRKSTKSSLRWGNRWNC